MDDGDRGGHGCGQQYLKAVYASQPNSSGASGSDGYGWTDRVGTLRSTLGAGVTKGVAGAIGGDRQCGHVQRYQHRYRVHDQVGQPAEHLLDEGWFKTNRTTGGKLFGFGDKQSANSSTYDRQIYMDKAGKIVFGVNDGGTATVSSTATYRNNAWHHVVATLSQSGMKLYVDGALVGQKLLRRRPEWILGLLADRRGQPSGWPRSRPATSSRAAWTRSRCTTES